MAPILSFLISSGSKKKEPECVLLSEAKASHSHKMWTEVSSLVPHFLQVGLLLSPIIYKCLLKVLWPVSRPITTLDCVLLKDNNRTHVARSEPEINCRASLCVLHRQRLNTRCWFSWQRFTFIFIFCLETPKKGSVQQTVGQNRPLRACRRFHFLALSVIMNRLGPLGGCCAMVKENVATVTLLIRMVIIYTIYFKVWRCAFAQIGTNVLTLFITCVLVALHCSSMTPRNVPLIYTNKILYHAYIFQCHLRQTQEAQYQDFKRI